MSIKREMPITKASRVYSGPEVRGTRPVLVTFESFKDRDEVLRKVCEFCTFLSCVLTLYIYCCRPGSSRKPTFMLKRI